jgi:MFS superfamily sulfate permease-like transporter
VFTDLLTGVLLGVTLTAAKLIYTVSHLSTRADRDEARQEIHLHLEGAATFISLPKLARALEQVPPRWTVHVYLDDLSFIDHSCLHLLAEWEKQHQATGGRLTLDQDGLRARFDRARARPANGNGPNGKAGAASHPPADFPGEVLKA